MHEIKLADMGAGGEEATCSTVAENARLTTERPPLPGPLLHRRRGRQDPKLLISMAVHPAPLPIRTCLAYSDGNSVGVINIKGG